MKIITRLLLHNICKQRNIDAVLNIARAFELHQVVVAGRKKTETELGAAAKDNEGVDDDDDDDEGDQPQQQQQRQVDLKFFRFFRECISWLKGLENHVLVGIEIDPNAVPATKLRETVVSAVRAARAAARRKEQQEQQETEKNEEEAADDGLTINVTFLSGSEGQGLLPSEMEHVDVFVYVPQFQIYARHGGGAGSLNVATATTVCLSEFFNPTPTSPSLITEKSSSSLHLRPDNFFLIPAVFHQNEKTSDEMDQQQQHDPGVHFLVRPCSSFGAHTLGVMVAGGGKLRVSNRSKFGQLMRAEQHCEVESVASVFQFVRWVREQALKQQRAVLVVGIVNSSSGADNADSNNLDYNFDLRRSQLDVCSLIASKAEEGIHQQQGLTLAVVFGRMNWDKGSELELAPNERSHCDMVIDASRYARHGLNVACSLSLTLHSLCQRLQPLVHAAEIGGGITAAADGGGLAAASASMTGGNLNKFSVALRVEETGAEQQKQQRAEVAKKRAEMREAQMEEDLGGFFA